MQNNNWNKNYTQNTLQRVQLQDTIKVVMPDDVLDKIQQLCRVISTVEWSGILLYKTEGSIQDPKNMVITLKDIILMNKGSQAYTEYSFTEKKRDQSGYSDRHIDYCEEFEEALEWQIGHIHSHNTMKVFFSGTDMAELDDNSPSHNFYLSLIVNNAMDFVAKVAFIASAEVKGEVNYIALDENGNEYNIERTTLKAKKDKLFIYDCEIETNLDKREPDNFFQRNLREVLAEVNKPVVGKSYSSPGNYKTGTGYSAPVIPNTPTYNPYPSSYDSTYNSEENLLEDDIDVSPDIEIFTMQLLNGTNEPEEGTTFEDLLLQLKMLKVSGEYIAKSVLDNFFTLFEKYYEDYTADEGVFLEVVEEVTEFLELYEFKHNILTPTILALKKMVKEYLNMEKQ